MSEYQCFELQALDRPLSREQMDELRRYSSRARITPTGFVNEYHFADFRGSPGRWMASFFDAFFDAFVHLANWGTRWLMLWSPMALLSSQRVAMYRTPGEALTFRDAEEHVVLSFSANSDCRFWVIYPSHTPFTRGSPRP